VLKGEELARKEFRSRREKLGQVEMAAGDRNVNVYRHLAAIDPGDPRDARNRLAGVIARVGGHDLALFA